MAKNQLFVRVLPQLTGYVVRRMPADARQEAGDLVQEVCIDLDRAIRNGNYEHEHVDGFWRFLRSIASNRITDFVRGRHAQKRRPANGVVMGDVALERLSEFVDDQTASRILSRKELETAISAAIEQLPARQREAIIGMAKGLTRAEIAVHLGVSHGSVGHLQRSAKEAIRSFLAGWTMGY